MFVILNGANAIIKNGKLEIISTNGMVDGTEVSTGGSSAVYCDGGNITMENMEIIGSQRGGHRAIEVYDGIGTFTNVNIDVNYGLGINAGAGAKATLTDCNITVKNSTLTMAAGYSAISCSSADIRFENSDITISCSGTTVDASYGVIVFDNCDLSLTGREGEPLLIAARYYSYYLDDPEAGDRNWGEPYLGAISFLNMDITAPGDVNVGYVEEEGYGYTSGYVTLKDSADGFITGLQAVGTKVDPTISQVGANLSYEDLIYVIDIFDVQNAGDIDLTTDAGMLIWTKDEFEAMDGIVFDADHAVVGLKPYKDTGYYYAMSDGIYTRDLHVENYYVGYLKLSDGSYVFSGAKLYNPAIYAENMLGKENTDTETRDLCVALLNFNAAAQQYFHPGTDKDDLVNSGLTDDERELDWTNVALNLAPVVPEEVMIERDSNVFTATFRLNLKEEKKGFPGVRF